MTQHISRIKILNFHDDLVQNVEMPIAYKPVRLYASLDIYCVSLCAYAPSFVQRLCVRSCACMYIYVRTYVCTSHMHAHSICMYTCYDVGV